MRADTGEMPPGVHRGNDDLGAVAEVLMALNVNNEKAKGLIAQWMSLLQTEVLGLVETMVMRIQMENEVALRQVFSTMPPPPRRQGEAATVAGEFGGWQGGSLIEPGTKTKRQTSGGEKRNDPKVQMLDMPPSTRMRYPPDMSDLSTSTPQSVGSASPGSDEFVQHVTAIQSDPSFDRLKNHASTDMPPDTNAYGSAGGDPRPPSTPAPMATLVAARHRANMRDAQERFKGPEPMVHPFVLAEPTPDYAALNTVGRHQTVPDLTGLSAVGRQQTPDDAASSTDRRHPPVSSSCSEDEYIIEDVDSTLPSELNDGSVKNDDFRNKRNGFIADPAAMKEQVRELLAKPDASPNSRYKDEGFWQAVAKHPLFENVSLVIISLNAVWLSVDIDLNREVVLHRAETLFQIAEHLFCLFFVAEWMVRFCAFKNKRASFMDRWFAFDTALVSMMVFETWVLNVVFLVLTDRFGADLLDTGGRDASILRMLRLARLTRVARCIRLLRSFPELLILLKGLWVASRSVIFTLILLFVIIYIFAIAFRQLTDGKPIGKKYFSSVPVSIGSLLLRGTLPDLADLVYDMGAADMFLAVVLFAFILLASLTVMNMLVGVLVEVVKVVSTVEQEELMVSFVKTKLYELVREEAIDHDSNGMLRRNEFLGMLANGRCARFIRDCGVDVVGLVDLTDLIFRDTEEIELFSFVELILQLRGSNNATVKDLVDMRKFMMQELRNVVVEIKVMLDPDVQVTPLSSTRRRAVYNDGRTSAVASNAAKRGQKTNVTEKEQWLRRSLTSWAITGSEKNKKDGRADSQPLPERRPLEAQRRAERPPPRAPRPAVPALRDISEINAQAALASPAQQNARRNVESSTLEPYFDKRQLFTRKEPRGFVHYTRPLPEFADMQFYEELPPILPPRPLPRDCFRDFYPMRPHAGHPHLDPSFLATYEPPPVPVDYHPEVPAVPPTYLPLPLPGRASPYWDNGEDV